MLPDRSPNDARDGALMDAVFLAELLLRYGLVGNAPADCVNDLGREFGVADFIAAPHATALCDLGVVRSSSTEPQVTRIDTEPHVARMADVHPKFCGDGSIREFVGEPMNERLLPVVGDAGVAGLVGFAEPEPAVIVATLVDLLPEALLDGDSLECAVSTLGSHGQEDITL